MPRWLWLLSRGRAIGSGWRGAAQFQRIGRPPPSECGSCAWPNASSLARCPVKTLRNCGLVHRLCVEPSEYQAAFRPSWEQGDEHDRMVCSSRSNRLPRGYGHYCHHRGWGLVDSLDESNRREAARPAVTAHSPLLALKDQTTVGCRRI